MQENCLENDALSELLATGHYAELAPASRHISASRLIHNFIGFPFGHLFSYLLSLGIFCLLSNHESCFSAIDGLRSFSDRVEGEGQIPDHIAFASAVSNLASNSQSLVIELNGA